MIPVGFYPVPGFPDYYVSRDGRVWSEKRQAFLTLTPNKKTGYLQVCFSDPSNRAKNKDGTMRRNRGFGVHRLVALTFLPPVKGKTKVNHLSGVKTDNRVENLEWCSNRENSHHARLTGLKTALLTWEQRESLRQDWQANPVRGYTVELGKKYNITRSQVRAYLRGVSTPKFNWDREMYADIHKNYRPQACVKTTPEVSAKGLAGKWGISANLVKTIARAKNNDFVERTLK